MADRPSPRWLLWALLVVAGGSVAWYWVMGEMSGSRPGRNWLEQQVIFFAYFTILTNTLAAAMAGSLLFGRDGPVHRFFSKTSVQGAVASYILFVGIGRWTLLGAPGEGDITSWVGWVPELGTHAVAPLLGLMWFLIGVPHGRLTSRDSLWWLAYPFAYYAFWLAFGWLLVQYPYPFMDFPALGVVGSITWALALSVVALVFAFGFLGLDRILGRRPTTAVGDGS
jgi:hypothetical protein